MNSEVNLQTELNSSEVVRTDGPPPGFGRDLHQSLQQSIVVVDGRIIALVGASLTIAALLLANRLSGFWPSAFHWIAVGGFGVSALLRTMALYPRLQDWEGKGLIFWEDILSRKGPAEYHTDLQRLDLPQVEREYAFHNFYLSNVLRSKCHAFKWCISLFIIGLLSVLMSFALA